MQEQRHRAGLHGVTAFFVALYRPFLLANGVCFASNRAEWCEARKHWHTGEFARVVDEMIARNAGSESKAYASYNLQHVRVSSK